MLLGAHLSIAGGLHKALLRAIELGCTALQIFTHANVQWRIAPLDSEDVRRFREIRARRGPFAMAAHANYLINLASPERALRERSIRTLRVTLERCDQLGIPLLVLHPGAHRGSGERAGLRRVSGALNRVLRASSGGRARIALETTAGQGSGLGHQFEQLARLLDGLRAPARAAVCFDTAHAFAAGYDFRTRARYEEMWRRFDRIIGLRRLAFFHLNDSARACGSRIDRHAHIGAGMIGDDPFGWLLADRRFRRVPKVIETPKEGGMDRRNLTRLRRLARRAGALLTFLIVAASLLLGGCAREDRWWDQVTGFTADSLGLIDRWEATVPGASGGELVARMASGELARLDFSADAGGYSIVYNHGRMVRMRPGPPQEMLTDRTLLLTYLVPFLGRARLGEALTALGIDTNQVAFDVEWQGRRCIRIGGAETAHTPRASADSADAAERITAPAIYFAAETGAVLRLVTVSISPIGRRVGEFRLYDHRLCGDARLPQRLETWSPARLRSTLQLVESRRGEAIPAALFHLPPPPNGMR
ncbi:MAG: deoxyribonuclease IV [Candidatus Eisenbacteria bacterium]|nr:deoxyribonuclease IV [Candidatus Eisenbacteria bacterium]